MRVCSLPSLSRYGFTTLKSDPVYLADFTCSPSALCFKLFPVPFPPLQSLSVCLLQSKVKKSQASQAWESSPFLFFFFNLAFFNVYDSGWCPWWKSVPLYSVIWSRHPLLLFGFSIMQWKLGRKCSAVLAQVWFLMGFGFLFFWVFLNFQFSFWNATAQSVCHAIFPAGLLQC